MASNERFEGNVRIASGGLVIELDLSRFEKQFAEAQERLGEAVLQDCKPLMPLATGALQQNSYVGDDGRKVVFNSVYASFQYGGLVMVDPDTNSPWARAGASKVLTDRPLHYSRAEAVDHWFDEAKAQNLDYWLSLVKKIAGGG